MRENDPSEALLSHGERQESEKQFRTYFDHTPIGMAIVGLDEHILQANNALCQMLGYSHETLLARTLRDITHPDDLSSTISLKNQGPTAPGEVSQQEKRYIHADGHIVYGQLSTLLMKDSTDTPLYYLSQFQDLTVSKQNEQALRHALEQAEQEHAKAEAILAAIGAPLSIQDREFRIVYQNEANKKFMGDHQGEHCFSAYEQNTEVCEGCALARSFADGKVHHAERSVVLGNEKKFFEITASPLLDKFGNPIAGIEIARDITSRTNNTTLLAEQVGLLSLSSDIGAVLTKTRSIRSMLNGCCELLVHHLGAAFARAWTVNEPGDHLVLQASAGLYTHLDGPHSSIPINQKTKIGTIGSSRIPHISNSVIGDPQISNQAWAKQEGMVAFAGHPLLIEDRLIGVIGMFFRHQLTESTNRAIASIADEVALGIERLRVEDKLRHSNRALRILGRGNEAMIQARSEPELLKKICDIIVEPEGYVMAWVGYAQEDAAKTVHPMAHAGFVDGYLDSIKVSWDDSLTGQGPAGTAIRTGKMHVSKNVYATPAFTLWREEAKKRGYVSILALPLSDSASRPFGSLCIYSSEADAFDDEEVKLLSDLAKDLSFGINGIRLQEERARDQQEKEKLQERLRHAQKMEAIGTLAGGIAHDFNNILTAILGYSELLKEEIEGQGPAWGDLQQVITAGRRAADLVRQILTISRQSEQERQPVKLQHIIKEALKLLRPSISALVDIKSTIDPQCPAVFADPTEIHQVIMNLCTNANHALLEKKEGDHTLEISLIPVELSSESPLDLTLDVPCRRFVKLTVSDTGCGMDANTMTRIFEPYFTTKKKGDGTGLGMALVHGIVKELDGDISVESAIGQGTIFTVFLPEYIPPYAQKETMATTWTNTQGNEQILIIDDEEPITAFLKRMLEKIGYRVTAVTSGEEAKRLFTEQPNTFDLIITDMNMPKTMGTELAQFFLQTRPDIPIILCTGYTELTDIEQAKHLGIKEVIYKPVDKNSLLMLIKKLLDRR